MLLPPMCWHGIHHAGLGQILCAPHTSSREPGDLCGNGMRLSFVRHSARRSPAPAAVLDLPVVGTGDLPLHGFVRFRSSVASFLRIPARRYILDGRPGLTCATVRGAAANTSSLFP